jgi:hypothetical protein
MGKIEKIEQEHFWALYRSLRLRYAISPIKPTRA